MLLLRGQSGFPSIHLPTAGRRDWTESDIRTARRRSRGFALSAYHDHREILALSLGRRNRYHRLFDRGGNESFRCPACVRLSSGAWDFSALFFVALGQATVQTTYTYLGYYNVCYLGGEVREPERNIPRSIFISIIGIAILYLAMQFSILGAVPWKEASQSEYIVSLFVERIFGTGAANVATVTILWIAFASLFAAMLGYSRVPYAAATDGTFFSVFARLHEKKHFPHLSLLALGGAALVFSVTFKLTDAIKALLAMRILVQFMGQAVGVMILRKRWPADRFPFKMWLYPLPAVLALIFWAFVFLSTGETFVLGAFVSIFLGVVAFFLRARYLKEWPFVSEKVVSR